MSRNASSLDFVPQNRLNSLMIIVDVMDKFSKVHMFENIINVINKLFSNIEWFSAIDIVVDIHERAYKFLLWLKMLVMLILPSRPISLLVKLIIKCVPSGF